MELLQNGIATPRLSDSIVANEAYHSRYPSVDANWLWRLV